MEYIPLDFKFAKHNERIPLVCLIDEPELLEDVKKNCIIYNALTEKYSYPSWMTNKKEKLKRLRKVQRKYKKRKR